MTATFNVDLSTAKDRVRFIVGDTNMAAPETQDETIAALLAANAADENKAALAVADYLLLLYAREPDTVEVTAAVKVAFTSRLAAGADRHQAADRHGRGGRAGRVHPVRHADDDRGVGHAVGAAAAHQRADGRLGRWHPC
jgi:hypothetical protein